MWAKSDDNFSVSTRDALVLLSEDGEDSEKAKRLFPAIRSELLKAKSLSHAMLSHYSRHSQKKPFYPLEYHGIVLQVLTVLRASAFDWDAVIANPPEMVLTLFVCRPFEGLVSKYLERFPMRAYVVAKCLLMVEKVFPSNLYGFRWSGLRNMLASKYPIYFGCVLEGRCGGRPNKLSVNHTFRENPRAWLDAKWAQWKALRCVSMEFICDCLAQVMPKESVALMPSINNYAADFLGSIMFSGIKPMALLLHLFCIPLPDHLVGTLNPKDWEMGDAFRLFFIHNVIGNWCGFSENDDPINGLDHQTCLLQALSLKILVHIVESDKISCGNDDDEMEWALVSLKAIFRYHLSLLSQKGLPLSSNFGNFSKMFRNGTNWFRDFLMGCYSKDSHRWQKIMMMTRQDNASVILDCIDAYIQNIFELDKMDLGAKPFSSIYLPLSLTMAKEGPYDDSFKSNFLIGYFVLRYFYMGQSNGYSPLSRYYPFEVLYEFPWSSMIDKHFGYHGKGDSELFGRVVQLINKLVPNIFDVRNQLRLMTHGVDQIKRCRDESVLPISASTLGHLDRIPRKSFPTFLHKLLEELVCGAGHARNPRKLWKRVILPNLEVLNESEGETVRLICLFWAQCFPSDPLGYCQDFLETFSKGLGADARTLKLIFSNPLSGIVSRDVESLFFIHPVISRLGFQIVQFVVESSKQMYRHNIKISQSRRPFMLVRGKEVKDFEGIEVGLSDDDLERFLVLQDSGLIQMLLDLYFCHESDDREAGLLVDGVISDFSLFLHEKFLCQPFLCHLIQQQTYPIRAIPFMVKLVPSMHIALGWFREYVCVKPLGFWRMERLIDSPEDRGKFVFAVTLARYLFPHYPVASSLSLAREMIRIFLETFNYCATTLQPDSILEHLFLSDGVAAPFLEALGALSPSLGIQSLEAIFSIVGVVGRYRGKTLGRCAINILQKHNVIVHVHISNNK